MSRKFVILPKSLHLLIWNIDKLREEVWESLKSYILREQPDIVCLNETKMSERDLIPYFQQLKAYNYIINSHFPVRWHGVAILIKKHITYQQIPVTLSCPPRSDNKSGDATIGRLSCILVDNDFYLLNTYVPNSGVDRNNPLKNLPYRLQWDNSIRELLRNLRKDHPVIWTGDLNIAPDNIDVNNPKTLRGKAGFTDEERESFAQIMSDGWIDIWRVQHPEERQYSYRGYGNYRYRWRLDHIIVSKDIENRIRRSYILEDFPAPTDHVPVGCIISRCT